MKEPTVSSRVIISFIGGITALLLVAWIYSQRTSTVHPLLPTMASPSHEDAATDLIFTKIGDLPVVVDATASPVHIQFTDGEHGWFSDDGRLWRTDNGGKTWLFLQEWPQGSIREVQFVDQLLGWIAINDTVYRTSDGGVTWTVFRQPVEIPRGTFVSFYFLPDKRSGWIAGAIYTPLRRVDYDEDGAVLVPNRYISADQRKALRGAIFFTSDGGHTWHQELLTRNWGYLGIVFARDALDAWATGTAGVFYRQNIGWREVDDSLEDEAAVDPVKSLEVDIGFPTFSPQSVSFLNRTIGWLTNSNGRVAMTTDGGNKWRDMGAPSGETNGRPVFFLQLSFVDEDRGLGFSNDGSIYFTQNGGRSWQKEIQDGPLLAVEVIAPGNAWAVTKDALFRVGLKPRR